MGRNEYFLVKIGKNSEKLVFFGMCVLKTCANCSKCVHMYEVAILAQKPNGIYWIQNVQGHGWVEG